MTIIDFVCWGAIGLLFLWALCKNMSLESTVDKLVAENLLLLAENLTYKQRYGELKTNDGDK